ncbi:helix-turn-helix domain-containing protein [Mitsuokella sp. UBA4253]|uniref:helix-turn-helix domain-containing protein n=1 Tax=Mitsuokella sp. UBA4253 TaxID=1946959 RepID=UPI0025805CAF|nr:helix-turn-helix transcriptional regulator [Mitsuokella sp. UBA4253]
MTINQRIKKLRKSLGMNQGEFGQKIGMGQAGISKIEQDGNTVIDQNIRLICQTFHVSEKWLRTGAGPMESDDVSTMLARLQEEMDLTDLEMRLLQTYFSFPAEERQTFLAMAQKFAARLAAEKSPEERDRQREQATLDAVRQEFRDKRDSPTSTPSTITTTAK